MKTYDISSWIAHQSVQSPKKIAIRFEAKETTYSQLEDRVASLSGALSGSLRIQRGDRVAFLGLNCLEILELLFACARVGAIFVPLNARMTNGQLRVFLENATPRCLFADAAFLAAAQGCLESIPDIDLVRFGGDAQRHDNVYEIETLLAKATPIECGQRFPLSTPVLMAYTSGTTGAPKGALLSQEAVYYSALNAIRMFEMTSQDEILTVIPMYHIGGLSIQSVPAIHAGATVTIHRQFDPAMTLYDIERYRITLFVGRPVVSRAVSSHPDWDQTDLSSIRSHGSGSTRVSLASMAPWFARGVPVQQLYGMTEVLPPVIAVSIGDARRKAGSIGKPAAHVEARVVDEYMRDVRPGDRGEIVLRSKCVFSEYWKNAEATRQTLRDGWFLTGDVGHVDEDGFFYVDDRIKDMVIVGASNVYPVDGERILAECDDIEEAAIVGKPDPVLGESLVACVVLKKGRKMTSNQLQSLFKGRLANYQHPHHVMFMESIPHNALGKIQKAELRRIVRD
ncbi:MAG: AMP-binding protein [Alphaproteobacteria bacterium]|nr:AMP-binding protein [Alphaproteobacteria bacterium]